MHPITIRAGIQPNILPIYKKVNRLQMGDTKMSGAKVKVLSTAKRSDEIIAISLPEFVFARLSTLNAVTLSNITAQRVLRMRIEIM